MTERADILRLQAEIQQKEERSKDSRSPARLLCTRYLHLRKVLRYLVMADVRYCLTCKEDIDFDVDFFHYHEPLNSRCTICGAKCYSSRCLGCSQGISDVQLEEREMVGTRVRKNTDDD